jgi:hypothetical protein
VQLPTAQMPGRRHLQEPWHYTIGAGDRLISEQWHDDGPLNAHDLTVRGPNGFWRRYVGSLTPDASHVEVVIKSTDDRSHRAHVHGVNVGIDGCCADACIEDGIQTETAFSHCERITA